MQPWRLLCLRNKTNAVGFSSNFIKYSFHVNSPKPVTICFANHNQHVWTALGLSEKVERRVVVGGSGEGGRRRFSSNFSSFNFATRPQPRLSSPLLNLTSSASLVSSKVSERWAERGSMWRITSDSVVLDGTSLSHQVLNKFSLFRPISVSLLTLSNLHHLLVSKKLLSSFAKFQACLWIPLGFLPFSHRLQNFGTRLVFILDNWLGHPGWFSSWLICILVGFHHSQLGWSSWLVFILDNSVFNTLYFRLVFLIGWATAATLSTSYSTSRSTPQTPSLKTLTFLTSSKLSLTRRMRSLWDQWAPNTILLLLLSRKDPHFHQYLHSLVDQNKVKSLHQLEWDLTKKKLLRNFSSLTLAPKILILLGRDSA